MMPLAPEVWQYNAILRYWVEEKNRDHSWLDLVLRTILQYLTFSWHVGGIYLVWTFLPFQLLIKCLRPL